MIMLEAINDLSDRNFVEELFENYASMMYRVAYGILYDRISSEDAVQISFERIIKYLHRIKDIPREKVGAYLTVICKNAAKEIYNDRLLLNNEYAFVENVSDKSYDPRRVYTENEDLQNLIELINSLPPIYSDVLMLKYYCELDEDIIADALEISIYSLRKRVTRGKKMLRQLLENNRKKSLGGERL